MNKWHIFFAAGITFVVLAIVIMISATSRAKVRAEADNGPAIFYGAEILANACVSSADVETLAGCIEDVQNDREPFQ